MTGTTEAAGTTGGASTSAAGTEAGDFNVRFRKRRGGVAGNGGGVGAASAVAAKRRPTTKIAIPPKMNGVSVTGT
jgi:hypothetical protein